MKTWSKPHSLTLNVILFYNFFMSEGSNGSHLEDATQIAASESQARFEWRFTFLDGLVRRPRKDLLIDGLEPTIFTTCLP